MDQPIVEMTRYNFLKQKPVVPSDMEYMTWVHLRYAEGASEETMRTELRAIGRNEKEIDLILAYLSRYVRDEMGIKPDNSRTSEAEGILTRTAKLYRKALADLATAVTNTHLLAEKSAIIELSYVVTLETLASWQQVLSTGLPPTIGFGLIGVNADVDNDTLELLAAECKERIVERTAAITDIENELLGLSNNSDIEALSFFDASAALKAKLTWMA